MFLIGVAFALTTMLLLVKLPIEYATGITALIFMLLGLIERGWFDRK